METDEFGRLCSASALWDAHWTTNTVLLSSAPNSPGLANGSPSGKPQSRVKRHANGTPKKTEAAKEAAAEAEVPDYFAMLKKKDDLKQLYADVYFKNGKPTSAAPPSQSDSEENCIQQ